jgi:hypothetical protein
MDAGAEDACALERTGATSAHKKTAANIDVLIEVKLLPSFVRRPIGQCRALPGEDV